MARDAGRTIGIIIVVIIIIYLITCAVVYQQAGAWSWTPWTHWMG